MNHVEYVATYNPASRHCQVCGDPEPAYCALYLIDGKANLQCCGKCREFVEAGGYSDDPDWRRFLKGAGGE